MVVTSNVPIVAAQKLNALFKFFLGEWFGDKRLGVPYFQYVFIKNPNMGVVRQVLMAVINSVPEITGVGSGDLRYLSSQRQATAKFVVKAGGALLTGGPGIPFVITGIGASPA